MWRSCLFFPPIIKINHQCFLINQFVALSVSAKSPSEKLMCFGFSFGG